MEMTGEGDALYRQVGSRSIQSRNRLIIVAVFHLTNSKYASLVEKMISNLIIAWSNEEDIMVVPKWDIGVEEA